MVQDFLRGADVYGETVLEVVAWPGQFYIESPSSWNCLLSISLTGT